MSPSSKKQTTGTRFRRIEPTSFSSGATEDVRTFFEVKTGGVEVRSWSLPGFVDDGFEASPFMGGQLDPEEHAAADSGTDLDNDSEAPVQGEISADDGAAAQASAEATDPSVHEEQTTVDEESSEAVQAESAEERLEALIEQAVTEALEAQKEVLIEEVQAPYVESVRVLEKATEKLNTLMTERLVELAHRLAEAVIRREVGLEPEAILASLEQAIQVAGPMTQVVVDCHPREEAFLRQSAPSIFEKKLGRAVELLFSPTSSVEPGDIVIRFEEGIVDAKWETQLQRLTDALRETPLQTVEDETEDDATPSDGHDDHETSDVAESTHESEET